MAQKERFITPAKAAEALEYSEQHVRRMVSSGELPGYSKQQGAKKLWLVDTEAPIYQELTRNSKETSTPVGPMSKAAFDFNEWAYFCKTGEGEVVKNRLSTPTFIEYNRYVTNFFNTYPDLNETTMRQALFYYVERETEEQDFYDSKRMLHQALMSVARYFLYKDIIGETEITRLAKQRPEKRKGIRPNRPCYEKAVIDKALKRVQNPTDYLPYQRVLNTAILLCMFKAGMRRNEVINLLLENVHLDEGWMEFKGKFGKWREVGITKELNKVMKEYLKIRPASNFPNFLLSEQGKPLYPRAVTRRMNRIGEQLKKEKGIQLKYNFNPHGIRRTSGTEYLNSGKLSAAEVRDMFGHSTLDVTTLYIGNNNKRLIEKMRKMG